MVSLWMGTLALALAAPDPVPALALAAPDTVPALALAAPDTAPDTVPLFTLAPVPVVGSRVSSALPLETRGVQVLDRAHLDRLPVSTVAEALRGALAVEVSSRSPAQTDLQLRGGTFEQVLVLVDGVRVSDAQTGHFDMNLTLPLDQVERIEILRGPGSAQYGSDALGGVINIVTRKPVAARREWGMRVEGGSFGTGTLALRQSLALPGGVLIRGAGEVGRSEGHRPGTAWEQDLLSMDVAAPLKGGRLTALAGVARRDFGAKDFYAPFPSVEETGTRTLRIQWTPEPERWRSRVEVIPGIHWRRHTDDFILIRERPEVYRNVHVSVQRGADLTFRLPLGTRHLAAAGVEWTEHSLASAALGDREEARYAVFAEASGAVGGGPVVGGGGSGVGGGRAAGGSAGRLHVSLGLRHDRLEGAGAEPRGPEGMRGQAGTRGVTSPSVAASILLTSDVRLRASWGQAFRAPSWTERFYADPGHIPNPDLGPERGRALEVGLQGDLRAGGARAAAGAGRWTGTWSLAGYQRVTRDLIDWARLAAGTAGAPGSGASNSGASNSGAPAPLVPGPWVPRNVGRADFTGVEGEVRWAREPGEGGVPVTAPVSWIGLHFSALRVRASTADTLESKYALRPLVEQAGVQVGQTLPGGWALVVTGLHGRRGGPGLAVPEPAFREWDVRLQHPRGWRGLAPWIDGKNLGGSTHLDLTGNPVAGRRWTLGVRTAPSR